MGKQFYLCLLILCAILSQGSVVASDENIETSSDLQIRQKRSNLTPIPSVGSLPRQNQDLRPTVAYIVRNGTVIAHGRIKGPYTIEVSAQILLRYRRRIIISVQDPGSRRFYIVRLGSYSFNPLPSDRDISEATADIRVIDRIPGHFDNNNQDGPSILNP